MPAWFWGCSKFLLLLFWVIILSVSNASLQKCPYYVEVFSRALQEHIATNKFQLGFAISVCFLCYCLQMLPLALKLVFLLCIATRECYKQIPTWVVTVINVHDDKKDFVMIENFCLIFHVCDVYFSSRIRFIYEHELNTFNMKCSYTF